MELIFSSEVEDFEKKIKKKKRDKLVGQSSPKRACDSGSQRPISYDVNVSIHTKWTVTDQNVDVLTQNKL